MKSLKWGYPALSEKRIEQGTMILLASEALRISERWYYAGSVQSVWPELVIEGFPLLESPIEIWPTALLHLTHAIGISLCVLCGFFRGPKRQLLLGILLVFNSFTAVGGTAIAKSLVLLQPALLLFILLTKNRPFIVIAILATMYGFNGMSKTGPEWIDGTAVSLFLTSNLWSIGLSDPPSGLFWTVLTRGTLLWEWLGFLLLVPLKHPLVFRFRFFYGLSAVLFHGILIFVSPFRVLSGVALSLWWTLLPERTSEKSPETPERRSILEIAIISLWGLWLLVSNLNHFGVDIGRNAKINLSRFSLYPSWALFSPSPQSGKVTATIALPGKAPVTYLHRSPELSVLLDVYRFAPFWEYFGDRVCKNRSGTLTLSVTRSGVEAPRKEKSCGP